MIEATETYEGLEVLKGELTLFMADNKAVHELCLFRTGEVVSQGKKNLSVSDISIYLQELITRFFIKNPLVNSLNIINNEKITFVVEPV